MKDKKYKYRGRELYVRENPAVNTMLYAVYFRDKKGYERRLTLNDELDVYKTPQEAQAALDAFAERRSLEAA